MSDGEFSEMMGAMLGDDGEEDLFNAARTDGLDDALVEYDDEHVYTVSEPYLPASVAEQDENGRLVLRLTERQAYILASSIAVDCGFMGMPTSMVDVDHTLGTIIEMLEPGEQIPVPDFGGMRVVLARQLSQMECVGGNWEMLIANIRSVLFLIDFGVLSKEIGTTLIGLIGDRIKSEVQTSNLGKGLDEAREKYGVVPPGATLRSEDGLALIEGLHGSGLFEQNDVEVDMKRAADDPEYRVRVVGDLLSKVTGISRDQIDLDEPMGGE